MEGILRLERRSAESSFSGGRMSFCTRSGELIALLDGRNGRGATKHFEMLWRATATPQITTASMILEAPARLLLRRIARPSEDNVWDLLVSPHDWLTVSLAGVLMDADQEAYAGLIQRLQGCVEPIDWPEWIPADERMPLGGTALPDGINQEIWSALREALVEALPLEEDQVFYDLDISLLEMDSIDLLTVIMSLEEALEIAISDNDGDELIPIEGPLWVAYENIRELVSR